MPRKITANLVFTYPSTDMAGKLLASVEPDNEGYIHSFVEASNLISKAEEENILAMRSTIDDFLVCLATSEKVIFTGERQADNGE